MCTSTTLNQLEDDACHALSGVTSGLGVNVATEDEEGTPTGAGAGTGTDMVTVKGIAMNDKELDSTQQNALRYIRNSTEGYQQDNPSTQSQPQSQLQATKNLSAPLAYSSKVKQRLNSHDGSTISLEENLKNEELERLKHNGPYLDPGIVDFICVVGAKNIGDQKDDDGGKGWVNSEPECCVLEQFPSNDYHKSNGRLVTLMLVLVHGIYLFGLTSDLFLDRVCFPKEWSGGVFQRVVKCGEVTNLHHIWI